MMTIWMSQEKARSYLLQISD